MTSSPPPPFDDGGELPDTRVDDRPRGGADEREPNYLIRRVIAIGVAIALLAGGSVVAGRIIGGGDDDGAEPPTSADWDTVVVVADDEVRLVDPETGDVTATFPGEEALLDAESIATGHQLVLMNDFGRITQLDLTDGTIRRSSAPEASTLTVSAENGSIVLAGPPTGGEVAVVDTETGANLLVGDVAGLTDPLMFGGQVLVNRSGRHIAAADARSFQSVLVDIENATAVLLAGQVVALDDETVVTAQRAGANAELEFYDLEGNRRGSADAPSPQVTLLTDESTALIVSADGTVSSVVAKGAVNEVGVIAADEPGTTAEVLGGETALDSTRLLVLTSEEVVVVDQEGGVITRAAGELLSPAGRVTECALIGSTRPTGTAVHVDLETGELLGEVAGGIVASSSADGCTVSVIGDAPRVVARGVEVDATTTTGSITIAPDGRAYVVTTLTSEQLVELRAEDETGEPAVVDLADGPVLIRFAKV